MLVNIVIGLVLVGLAILFIFLASRALRAKRAWIKWPGLVLSGLLALVFVAVIGVVLVGYYKLNFPPYQYSTSDVKVAGTPEQIARGQLRAHICADCHSSDGSSTTLAGSKDNFLGGGGPPMGIMYAPNLTPGGPMKDWTDGQVLRALREGVDKDGRPLLIMPSVAMHWLSDADAQDIVAYLRSQPAVNRDLPKRSLSPVAAAFIGLGMIPTSAQTPITAPVTAPPAGPTAEYGEYLTHVMGCRDCHGPQLAGLPPGGFGPPPAPNLTLVVPQWKEEDLMNVFRNGVMPGGVKMNEMPWKNLGLAMTDNEIKALYLYLHSLEPVASAGK